MSELAVITRPAMARGYRLAGVLAEAASDPAEAEAAIASLLEQDGVAVLAIDEDLLTAVEKVWRQRIADRGIHCVPLPPVFPATTEAKE